MMFHGKKLADRIRLLAAREENLDRELLQATNEDWFASILRQKEETTRDLALLRELRDGRLLIPRPKAEAALRRRAGQLREEFQLAQSRLRQTEAEIASIERVRMLMK